MKNSRFLPVFVLILVAGYAFPQSGRLVPRDVFIADEAELSFDLASFAGFGDTPEILTVPRENFPVSPDVTVKSIQIVPSEPAGSAVVTIRFVPWISGVLQIPPFMVARTRIVSPPVRIGSLVDKTGRTQLENPRSPLLIPGTTYLLYGFVALGLLGAAFVIAFVLRLRNYLLSSRSKKLMNRRLKTVTRKIRLLEKQIVRLDALLWYARFSGIVREYLGLFCTGTAESFFSATRMEIVSALPDFLRVPETDLAGRWERLLSRLDMIRFSGYPFAETRQEDINEIRDLITRCEAAALEAGDDDKL